MRSSSRYGLRAHHLAVFVSALFSVWACGINEGGPEDPGEPTLSWTNPGSSAASFPSGQGGRYGFGSPASVTDIAVWDIDISPNGAGLPSGGSTVTEGLKVYQKKCMACHGPTGTEGPFDVLAGRVPGDEFQFAEDRSLRSTVGSYWPFATTLFDYTRRAMPFDFPGSLSDEEVYGVVGAMLFLNDLLPEDAVVDSATVAEIIMPARDRFIPDDRTGGPIIR